MPDRPAQSLDVEWIAMKGGLKPANRISIEANRVADLEARARREGLATARAATLVEFPGRPPSAIVYVAHEPAYARHLAEVEAPLLEGVRVELPIERAAPLHLELGRLLGFPNCCAEEFVRRLRRSVTRRLDGRQAHEDFVAAEIAATASRRFLGRLNDLCPERRDRVITFYPCRYDCPGAAVYAAEVLRHLERHSPQATRRLAAALLGRFSITVGGRRGTEAEPVEETLTVNFAEL